MNKEEFLFLDDLSEHANLPRVLKNTPNLFQRELSNPKDKEIFFNKNISKTIEHKSNNFNKRFFFALSLIGFCIPHFNKSSDISYLFNIERTVFICISSPA